MGTLSLENALIAISSLIMLSTMSGLLFATLAQPRRDRPKLLFSLFCACLLLWSLIALTGALEGLRFGLDERLRLHLMASVVGLSSLAFFLFTVQLAGKTGQMAQRLVTASPVLLLGALLIIWTDSAYSAAFTPELTFQLLPPGYLALGVQIVYALVAFGIIMSSPPEPVRQMRLPGLLMLLAYASLLFETLLRVPIAVLLATVAAGRMGWVVLRLQLFTPITEVTSELRIANRDLRQTLLDLAAEREKTEALTQQLATMSQYRSDFLDQLGHHLRTPLNSIVGYSQLLLSGIYGEMNEKQSDRLGKLHRNANALLDVIRHMLDLNAIQSGRLELNYTAVALEPLVRGVFADVEQLRAEKNAQLTHSLPPDVLPVYGDEHWLRQVLVLLVDNALKFSLSAGSQAPEVTVTAANVRVVKGKSDDFPLPVLGWLGDGEWVVVSVIDQGIGIPQEDQARIFDEFSQSLDRQAGEFAGSGLGLAIAKRLVELHDGVIWVRSAPQQGSTFFVALRALRGEQEKAQ